MEYALKFSEATTFFQSHFIQELLCQDIYSDCQHITTQKKFQIKSILFARCHRLYPTLRES